jgi:isocitrate/isopropylmalate dehydrogenase
LLDHLGEARIADRVRAALHTTLRGNSLTPDLGGSATTAEFGDALIRNLAGH